YDVLVSTANPAVGATAPAASVLPTNWVNTGEGLTAAGDGVVDGRITVVKGVNSVTGVNFGIEQRPTANSFTTATFTNPGGINTITVPATSFSASDPSTGTVTSIVFTSFPANVTSMTVGGTQYTSTTFPVGGVTVAAPGGQPTQPVLIDPVDGGVVVNIPFQAIDNATYRSTNTGIVSIPFGVPLPLDLITFDASKQGTIAVLNWKTANETKVSQFEVERSVNGGEFAKVGTVAASNTAKGNYSFTDRKPGIGFDLYRLKMVDMDGKFTYSETRRLEFSDNKTDLVLFPNPATDELTVSFKSGNCSEVANAHVTIFDVAGRMVISKSWDDVCNNPSTIMNLRGLTDGAYYINVRNSGDNSVIMSKKFVKTK
ncbi:MAG: T9SS type A sorting domain-containing protein, partial [Sphingobacteriales bacterium]